MSEEQDIHWLARPSTIRKLWWIFGAVLVLTVLAQFAFEFKGYFGVDGWLAFGAGYGFVSCLAMVLFAKGLGFLLKRREEYYAGGNGDGGGDRDRRGRS